MRRNQEGRQRQGLSTIFKLLKEWYGKTDESQRTTLRLPYVGPNERFSSDEVTGAVQNWLKTQPKNFSDDIKKL
jgi:hypothetical protein